MKKDEFKKRVFPGTFIYDAKRKVIGKVTRIFPNENPSYAEYEDKGVLWGVFYPNMIYLSKEDLAKLKEKQNKLKSQQNEE